jgi:hypothetical protein
MHNVHVDRIEETQRKAKDNPSVATQAAMAGVELKGLRIGLKLSVDFRTAVGLGGSTPLSAFNFEVEVDTMAT